MTTVDEQTDYEHLSRRRSCQVWSWTGRSTSHCPSASSCGDASATNIAIPMTARLPTPRVTRLSPMNDDEASLVAARCEAMTSAATTATELPAYNTYTQFPIVPPMPVYGTLGSGGFIEDPSHDSDAWSIITPITSPSDSRASSTHGNSEDGILATSPSSRSSSSERGIQALKFTVSYFKAYILPLLFVFPMIVFYIWAWQIGICPVPGSEFYQQYAWFHTYPSPKLTTGGIWSIVGFFYSIIGGAFNHVYFQAWLGRVKEGITPLRQGDEEAELRANYNAIGARSCSWDCSGVAWVAAIIMYLLMVPLLVGAGLLSIYALLTTRAHGESQDGGY